jgi:hypothetical protein
MKGLVKWFARQLVGEFTKTLNESDSTMPGDWISPSAKIGVEAYGAATKYVKDKKKGRKEESSKQPEQTTVPVPLNVGHRTWNWNSCAVGEKICKGEPSCTNCGRCIHHCTCTSEAREWTCTHCDVPQLKTRSTCANCGAARPFSY